MDTKKKALIGVSAIAVLIILGFIGSRLFSKKVENPYEIMVNGKILSMYDSSIDDFEENGFEVCEGRFSSNSEKNNVTIYNDKIVDVTIYDNSVQIFKSISVGDNISKAESAFKYEVKHDNVGCDVTFNSANEEIDLSKEDINEGIRIFFVKKEDSNIISKISIVSDNIYFK